MNAKERYLVATTDAKRRELMDFVAGRELKHLEQPILHPSTSVLERTEAAEQALRPDEEILEARDKESDVGFPSPLNQGLTAEEQTELFKILLEKRKQKASAGAQDPSPVASEPEGSASAGDAMSSERAGVSDDTSSDKMSFVTATAGSLSLKAGDPEVLQGPKPVGSRKDRKKQRTAHHLQQRVGEGMVMVTPAENHMRKQIAVVLQVPGRSLGHLTGPQIQDLRWSLITMRVTLAGGEPIQTRLMALVHMTHAERDGVEGTLVKVSVAAESEVFLPTRDPNCSEESGGLGGNGRPNHGGLE
jgi:hypothetical protein